MSNILPPTPGGPLIHKAKAQSTCSFSQPEFLSLTEGESLHVDGVKQACMPEAIKACFFARKDSTGQTGWVYSAWVDIISDTGVQQLTMPVNSHLTSTESQAVCISPLCDVCQTLELFKTNNREPATYPLGTWEDVTRRAQAHPRCPFCVLIQSFLSQYGNSSYRSVTPDASTEWKKAGGFFFGTDGDNLAFLNEDTATSPYGCARAIQSNIDPALIKKWMKLCGAHHGETCAPKRGVIRASESEPGVKVLRLIDTEDQCIVEAVPGDRYLALSYVWGPVMPAVRLQQNNVAELSTKGAFYKHREILPKTIKDAIDLVQLIGERYLWVDSLCLIQDDGDDMLDGLSHMDLVYQCAILTIIAAHGADANAGLRGLHPGSRYAVQKTVEVLPGIKMTATTGVYNDMRGVHSTRGWTLQELVLSHRTLIFAEDRIYFRCRTNCWSEDTIYDNFPSAANDVLHSGGLVRFLEDEESKPLVAFNSQLFRYAPRKLTKESDTIHGITGILRFLSTQTKSGILEGLFTSSFDIGLLSWDPYPRLPKPTRRGGFPSWSWAGWPGISMGYGGFCKDTKSVNVWLQKMTYIVWYKRSPRTAKLKLVWDLDSQLKYGKPHEHRSGIGNPYGRDIHGLLENLKTRPDDEDVRRMEIIRKELNKRQYHFLHFFAHTAFVQEFTDPKEQSWTMLYEILGVGGITCGGIKFDDPNSMEEIKGPYELLLLSKMDKYDNFFNDSSIKFERPFFWVMLIVWLGEERVVAERRGIGYIFQDCTEYLLPPGRIWKEIVLA